MPLDRDLWQRARPLFDELVELEPAARRLRLEEVSATDPALREAVERLLAADAGAEGALRDYSFGSPDGQSLAVADQADPLGLVGKVISHFVVTGYLAAGGMGAVYTAEDLQLGRMVALKFPLPHQRMDDSVKSRFVQEARSAAALDHPNLCSVYEIGESAQGVFLAMPLYAGQTLKDRLGRERVLQPKDAMSILRQVLAGLSAAHAAGIVHRDLKPGNVMLLPDGTAKILDFGLAKVKDVSQTRSQATLGTVAYMAPEQIRAERVDARTDLWAMGVMLFEMLTGRRPFAGEHELSIVHSILHEDPPPPSEVNRALPPAFDAIISGLLQKDPALRYPSVDALLADVEAIDRGAAPAHRIPFWSRTRARRRARHSLLPATISLGLVAGVSGLAWYSGRHGAESGGPQLPALRFENNTVTISTSAELLAALTPENAGRTVYLRAGTYDIDQLLTVPDGMTIEGEGEMVFDDSGHPAGFRPATRTVLRMTSSVSGDVLTLGDRVTLRNLEIDDLVGRSGNVVVVASRRAQDTISATISETIIVNPHSPHISTDQLGVALFIATRNPNLGDHPPPHERSALAVRVSRSILRVPNFGIGFHVFNFAPRSSISLEVSHSVIGGASNANGGVSRPDSVHDSEVRIVSDSNIYRNEWEDPCAQDVTGWNLVGGSGAPFIVPRLAATVRNSLRIRSVGDRFERFSPAILARGGARFFGDALNLPPSDNLIDLQLVGTRFSGASCSDTRRSGDLWLSGAWAGFFGVQGPGSTGGEPLYPGDGNTLRVELRDVIGSGKRSNRYANTRNLTGPLEGEGNRLVIAGDPATFARSNRGIDPPPGAEFFTVAR